MHIIYPLHQICCVRDLLHCSYHIGATCPACPVICTSSSWNCKKLHIAFQVKWILQHLTHFHCCIRKWCWYGQLHNCVLWRQITAFSVMSSTERQVERQTAQWTVQWHTIYDWFDQKEIRWLIQKKSMGGLCFSPKNVIEIPENYQNANHFCNSTQTPWQKIAWNIMHDVLNSFLGICLFRRKTWYQKHWSGISCIES